MSPKKFARAIPNFDDVITKNSENDDVITKNSENDDVIARKWSILVIGAEGAGKFFRADS